MDSTTCSYELLVTHSRFADVYTLFEETMELMPEKVVKEFMSDVKDMRTKLDSWKTRFSYEKEKKTFLVEKCHARSTSESHSTRDSKDAQSQNGSSVNGSDCPTPSDSRPPSVHRRSTSMNNTPTLEETLDATLPLELDNENDETWLLSPPPAPAPTKSVIHESPVQQIPEAKLMTQPTESIKDQNMTPKLTTVQKAKDIFTRPSSSKSREDKRDTSVKESSKSESRLKRFLRKPSKKTPSPPSPSPMDEMVLRTASTAGLRTRIPRPPLSPNRSGRRRRGSSAERA